MVALSNTAYALGFGMPVLPDDVVEEVLELEEDDGDLELDAEMGVA